MRPVKSLFHVNFPTNHWDEMVDFYTNVCGFDQAFVITRADMDRMFGLPVKPGDEETPNGTYIRIKDNEYIELANVDINEKVIKADPTSSFHHISLLTPDLEKTARDLAAKGHPLIHSPLDPTPISLDPFEPHMGDDGCLIAWLQDPDGHNIEVMQETESSRQLQFEKDHPIED